METEITLDVLGFSHLHLRSVHPGHVFFFFDVARLEVDPVLSLTLIKCLTYGHLVQDLEKLISTKGAERRKSGAFWAESLDLFLAVLWL